MRTAIFLGLMFSTNTTPNETRIAAICGLASFFMIADIYELVFKGKREINRQREERKTV